jgi:hypothetical protein
MDLHEDIFDQLIGDGMIIVDGRDVAMVPYSLSVAPHASPLIAAGTISGPEPLMRKLKAAHDVRLALEDGLVVALRFKGGQSGIRWVEAVRA